MPLNTNEEGVAKIHIPENSNVSYVLKVFDIPEEEAYIVLINGRHAKKNFILHDGDEMYVFPAIVGG
ncbi:MAG: MoaD/ThiS family protein [Nitrospinota bacterium]|nr:MoaD/ThiS family protein [Nitrospinota bacterium]